MVIEVSQLDEQQKRVIDDFLAEHWDEFEIHCKERGEDPAEIGLALQS